MDRAGESFAALAPVVSNGRLYVLGDGLGERLYAYDAADGQPEWVSDDLLSGPVSIETPATPIIAGREVIVTGDGATAAIGASSGRFSWVSPTRYTGSGHGGAAHDGTLFAGGGSPAALILDSRTGTRTGSYDSFRAPTIDGQTRIDSPETLFRTGLTAVDDATGKTLWSVRSAERLVADPFAVGSDVISVTRTTIRAFSLTNGRRLWALAIRYRQPGSLHYGGIIPELADADGTLLVPEGSHLLAYGS